MLQALVATNTLSSKDNLFVSNKRRKNLLDKRYKGGQQSPISLEKDLMPPVNNGGTDRK